MDIRHSLACSIALGSLLAVVPAQQGQQPPPKPAPAGTVGPQPAAGSQDPETSIPKPVEETPEQRIQKLEEEQKKLQQEIKFVQERASKGAMAAMVQDKLQHRDLELKSIDAGASKGIEPVSNVPMQPQVRRARLMTDSEKPKMAADVVYLVAGQPIRQTEIDQLVEYQRSFSSSGDDNLRKLRAVMELLRIAAARSAFADTSAELEKRMQELRQQVDGSASFDELARKNTQGPNADKGGDISPVTRNSFHGLQIEHMAFTTKEDSCSPVFHSPMGLSMLWVKKFAKGATPEQDQVSAQLLTLNYSPDIAQVQMAASKVMTGQVDLVVRDEDAMQMLPVMFRPPVAQPGETDVDKAPKKTDEQQAVDEKASAGKSGDVKKQ